MSQIILTNHAKNQMNQRGIYVEEISKCLENRAQIVQNPRNPGISEVFEKIPYTKEPQYLLISFKESSSSVLVITAVICGIGHIRKEGFKI